MFVAWKFPKRLVGLLILSLGAVWIQVAAQHGGAGSVTASPSVGRVLMPMDRLTFHFPEPLKAGAVDVVPPSPGEVTISGSEATFRPLDPMRPGGTYQFAVTGVTVRGELYEAYFEYDIQPLGGELWTYVKLDDHPHEVYVFRGEELVRRMLASGGKTGDETPAGTYRIQNRGYHFYSQKYGEGAYYWVRIFGNYLFHSVPVDVHGRVIAHEAEKLGCPASHGCVRLGMEDAKWFYENVPDGSLVVIDRT